MGVMARSNIHHHGKNVKKKAAEICPLAVVQETKKTRTLGLKARMGGGGGRERGEDEVASSDSLAAALTE